MTAKRTTTKRPATDASEPPLIKRAIYLLGFVAVILAIVGFTAYALWNDVNAQFNSPRHEAKGVAEGVTLERFLTFEEENVFPIGLAQDDAGTFYLSRFGSNTLYKVNAQGERTLWKNYAAIGAMVYGSDGYLYVISYSEETQKNYGNVQRIDADGKVESLPPIPGNKGLPFFAQMAFDPAGNLYVTDPSGGRVWVYRPGLATPELWWTAAPVGNQQPQVLGIAYDPTKSAMLVSDVGTDSLYRVPLTGLAPLLILRQNRLDIQVVTVDGFGRVFLTIWEHDDASFNLLKDDGNLVRLADGFRSPTATLLRDKKAYVVNSDAPGLLQSQGLIRPRAKPPFTVDVIDLNAIIGG